MRTLASFYEYSRTQAEHVRVRVADSGGTLRDVTSYPGFNALKSAQWREKVNDATGVATVTLLRELGALSLSPWMAGSALNKGFDPAGAYEPLIALNRLFVIEVEVTPADKPPSGVWVEFFRGRIDEIDPAAGDCVTFTGRDLAGRLAEQQIKFERVYSLADDGGLVSLREWKADTIFNAGDYCLPAARGDGEPGQLKFYVLASGGGGASGLTEPAWSTGSGITDGALTWNYVGTLDTGGHLVESVIQNILDDNVQSGDSAVTLYVPSSPGWAVKEYQQDRTFTLDACRNLARQCGGDVRMKWDPGTSAFRLTLWFPDRAAASPLHTFAPDDYAEPRAMPINKATIRNSWRGIYTDPTDVLSDGKSLGRHQVEVQDAASIAKYGELWAEIQEDASSQIDTEAEMTAMLNAALSDCAEPTTELSIDLVRGFPWCELGDLYRFTADDLRFSSDFDLAVTGYQHTFAGGRLSTRLELRGKPSIGNEWWMTLTVGPFMLAASVLAGQHQQQSFSGQKTPSATITSTIGGARIVSSADVDKLARETFLEHHVYGTPGSTLSGSTLHTVARDRVTDFAHLVPGTIYYHRLVPRWLDGNRLIVDTPTSEKAFMAGYVEPMHLDPEKFQAELPPNGSFEGFSTAAGVAAPPDQWAMETGTWNTDVAVGPAKGGPDGVNGARYLRFLATSVATAVRSAWFPVTAAHVYELTAWFYKNSGDGDFVLEVEWVTSQQSAISTSSYTIDLGIFTASTWNQIRKTLVAPSTAAFARCRVKKASAHTDTGFVDALRLKWLGEPWVTFAGGDFSNSWAALKGGTSPAIRAENGRAWLKGSMAGGTVGSTAITIPTKLASLVPLTTVRVSAPDGADNGKPLEVNTSGQIRLVAGNNAAVYLDGISWPLS